jgi:hypothetical protein
MASEIAASVRRALRLTPTRMRDDVHFHLDTNGRPFVCDFHRCDSPSLSPGEVGVSQS